jgi:hypothetical protein
MLARYVFVISLFFSLPLTTEGQIDSQELKAPINPLPGYTWSGQRVKDGISGKFVREDGFTITLRGSAARGFYSKVFETGKAAVWRKDQVINGIKVAVARFDDDGEIAVLTDETEILSAKARTLDQVADLLLSIPALAQPNVDPPPAAEGNRAAPGNIRLLPGYVHERRRGKDSSPGVIAKVGGLSISYDIGEMAANYAIKYFPEHFERLRRRNHLNSDANERDIRVLSDQVLWRQSRSMKGDELMLVQLKDNKLIGSFAKASANFVASIDSDEELADFLLMVLTYDPK